MELIKINRQFGENTKHYIYRVLKMNIMTLNIKPGTGISEADIREFLKVSRTPIRESIVRLSEERLMDVYPQKGSFVSLIDLKIVEEAYFMRKILEKEVQKEKVWESIQSLSTHYDRVRFLDAIEKTNLIPTLEQHKTIIDIIKNKEIDKVDEMIDLHLSNFKNKIDYLIEKHPDYFKI